MRRWGFIYTLGDADAEVRRDRLGTPACELVELCGAFEATGLAAVVAEVDGAIPVGAVFYGGEAATGLHRLFG